MEDIEWLLHQPDGGRALKVNERTRISDAQWDAVIERIDVAPGLRVFLTHATIHSDITVQSRDPGSGPESTPWASSTIAVEGHVEIEIPDGLQVTAGPDQAVLFRPSGRDPRYHVKAPQRLRLAGYALRRDRLERMFDGAIPPALLPLLEPEMETSRVICMHATRRLRHLAEGLFAPGLNGPLRLLFVEGVVLQLLASQMASQIRPARILTAREREAVTTAHRLLLLDMRRPPGLGDLADAVGLSEKRLNACFRSEFGSTVFELLRNYRLEHARIALESGAAPLKQIAWRVGYNHVSNFINAYTARYGAPPRRHVLKKQVAAAMPASRAG
ncbi:MAG: helix-turn-helix transcriptional regulator [Ferrovibrio sp.]|uniref:helix-turn-helix transcriptional regulator n=1 Tax=Ferrovibrio sp. TaxID=1917215 RepID=UPI00391CAF25